MSSTSDSDIEIEAPRVSDEEAERLDAELSQILDTSPVEPPLKKKRIENIKS